MRNFLIVCLLACAMPSIAQEATKIDVATLIKSGRFSFIVTKIEKKPGLNGSSGYNFDGTKFYGITAGTTTIRESLYLTSGSSEPAKGNTQEYYRSAAGDGSYASTFNIPLADGGNNVVEKPIDKVVYFIQTKSAFLISNLDNPTTLSQIQNDSGKSILSKNVKFQSSKKSDGTFMLTYKIKDTEGSQTFYLEVMPDGRATLQTPPTKTESTILSGYILNVLDAT